MFLLLNPLVGQEEFHVKFSKALTQADSGKFSLAIQELLNLSSEINSTGSDSLQAAVFIKLGSTYCRANKCNIGLKYYQKAYRIVRQMSKKNLWPSVLFGLAAGYQTIRKYDSAIFYYRQSVRLFRENRDSTTLSFLYSNLGLLFGKMNNQDSSQAYFSKAVELQLELELMDYAADSYYNLGVIAADGNHLSEALTFFVECIRLQQLSSNEQGYAKVLRATARTQFKLGNYRQAANTFFLYDSLGHDVFHEDDKEKILELETKFKTAEIERDNAIKQTEIEENQRQLTILYFSISAIFLLAIASYFYVDQRRKRIKADLFRQEETTNQKIQDLLQQQEVRTAYALLEGQDKERKRIASELHDNLGSILVTLNMYADSLQTKTKVEEVKDIADRISNTSQKANEEVRKISHSLDTGLLKHFGLKAAITQLMEAVEMSKKIKIKLELQLEDHFTNETGLQVYRIIQELVNNSLKHSKCTTIRIEANHIKNHLSIIYEDNGKGFDTSEVKRGMGLSNVEQRIEKLEGTLEVDSTSGRGSTFIFDIPQT